MSSMLWSDLINLTPSYWGICRRRMSVAALRLIRCQRLSTSGPSGVKKVIQWKTLSKLLDIIGLPVSHFVL